MNHNSAPYTRSHEPGPPFVPAHGTEPCDSGGHALPHGPNLADCRKIEQSVVYMMQHLHQPLQVPKLAQMAHTSLSHFFVLFKRWAGFTPIDFFIHLRMQQADQLLAATSMSVKEIAAALGYSDPFYFSRVFKSVRGVAPSVYRLNMQGLEQTGLQEERPGLGKGELGPPLPNTDALENKG